MWQEIFYATASVCTIILTIVITGKFLGERFRRFHRRRQIDSDTLVGMDNLREWVISKFSELEDDIQAAKVKNQYIINSHIVCSVTMKEGVGYSIRNTSDRILKVDNETIQPGCVRVCKKDVLDETIFINFLLSTD